MRWFLFIAFVIFGCTSEHSKYPQITIGLGEEVNLINPLLSGTAYARQIEELVYLPLFQFDPEDLELKPVLATKPPILTKLKDDRIKYSFQIRPEATWSDGKSITGADYAFTFKMIYNQALKTGGYRAYLSFIDQIIVDEEDEKKVTVTTNKAYHLAETVLSNIEIFPKHIHDPKGILDTHSIAGLRLLDEPDSLMIQLATNFQEYGNASATSIVGSGPFELLEWEPKEAIVLKKKKDYWAEKVINKPVQLYAKSERLKFNFIKDRVIAFQELKSGGIDIMNQVPLINIKEILNEDNDQLKGFTPDQFTQYFIALNPENHGLENAELRKALNQCFDIHAWITNQMFDLAVPVTNPISPLKKYYDHTIPVTEYNPKLAIEVFEKYGYNQLNGDGIRFRKKGKVIEKLSFRLGFSSSNEAARGLSIFFKEKAKQAGIEIISRPMDFSNLRKAYAQGGYDLLFLASSVPPADYDPQQKWHTKSWGKGNRVRFGDKNSDLIIDKICGTIDPFERAEYYRQFQQSIEKSRPFMFLYSPKQRVVSRKDLNVSSSKLWPGYVTQLLH